MTLTGGVLLGIAAGAAGAINAVAGGGTLLTFPTLLGIGLPSTFANATSTSALAPASFAGAWSYRDRLDAEARRLLVPLGAIGLVGGTLGAFLLLKTPVETFNRLVPVLILVATLLFAFQGRLKPGEGDSRETNSVKLNFLTAVFLFGVAVYGGYFGAGIGILTLSAFGMLGMREIHRMNALKAIFAGGVNAVASVVFMAKGLVRWPEAALACACAIFGAWAGAGLAKKIGGGNVRRLVVVLGVGMALQTLWKFWT